jgi:hypothetical protein
VTGLMFGEPQFQPRADGVVRQDLPRGYLERRVEAVIDSLPVLAHDPGDVFCVFETPRRALPLDSFTDLCLRDPTVSEAPVRPPRLPYSASSVSHVRAGSPRAPGRISACAVGSRVSA